MQSSRLLQQHSVGALFGIVLASLATWRLVRTTEHLGATPLGFIIPLAIWITAFLIASPLLLGVLLSWNALTQRWPSLERQPLRRWFGLLGLALFTALSTHTILAVGGAFAAPDGFGWAEVRYRLVSERALFVLQMIAATAWLIMPRFFGFANTSSPDATDKLAPEAQGPIGDST